MKLVQVDWVDSTSSNDWRPVADAKRKAEEENALFCSSVGFLVADMPDYVLLACSYTPPTSEDAETVANTMQIPRCAIQSIRPLQVGRVVAR
jgi:hypothetical protein